MRFGGNQQTELAETCCSVQLSLVPIDVELTQVFEKAFRRDGPYEVRCEPRAERRRSLKPVDFNLHARQGTLTPYVNLAHGHEIDVDRPVEWKIDNIHVDRSQCQ